MGAPLPNKAVLEKEQDQSRFIPYGNQISKNTVKLKEGGYCQTIKLQGAAHQSADGSNINSWHRQLNMWLRNLASPNFAIWTHTVRREYNEYPGGDFENDFCRELNDKYRDRTQSQVLLINELYVTVIYRPNPVAALSLVDRLTPKSREARIIEQEEGLRVLDDAVNSCMSSLDRYDPELLGTYEHKGGLFSEVAEFYAFLLNGEWRRIPLARAQLCEILPAYRPYFGNGGVMALKRHTSPLYGAILGIQEYPNNVNPVILNELLSVPFEFVLAQSLTFLSKQVGKGRMERQQSRLVNAGDVSESQIDDISAALDDLISNEFAYGVHHFALHIKSDDQADLKDCISLAGTILADAMMTWGQEDDALMGAFYSLLPGNFSYRTRPSDITSRNFACFASMHNFPIGHIRKNQWGDAVTMFLTTSGAPYYFNFHKGEDGNEAKRAAALDPNHKDLANFICIGKSGGGKTVLEMFLLAQSLKFTELGKKVLSAFVFDKDLGASVAIPVMGGRYFALKNGVPTGINPFQLPITPDNISHVTALVKECIRREGHALTPRQEDSLAEAVEAVMNEKTAYEDRRFSSLLEFFDENEEFGLHVRIKRWTQGHELGWVFDNPKDTMSFADTNVIGIDVTAFLKNDETRSPMTFHLFHRMNQTLDGRRCPIFMDEFGQLIKTATFQSMTEDKLVTIRKLDGFLGMFTQFPRQILDSPVGAAIISQTATKIFLPNSEADFDDYVNGMKLTIREFEIIKGELDAKKFQFLVKQGENSVVAELNLKGMNDELAVLSGNAYTAGLAQRLMKKLGPDPAIWLPVFHKVRRGDIDESSI